MRPYDPVRSAIEKLVPGAQFTLFDGQNGIEWENEVDQIGRQTGKLVPKNIVWNDTRTMPSRAEIDAAIEEEKTDYKDKKYQRQRLSEYPPLSDLADALYWQSQGDESKMTAYLSAVQAVKEKYPKGNV